MPNPERIYLDYNATVPLKPAAREAMLAALDLVGNPSSVHRFGREARRLMEDARESVAAFVGADPSEVIFTAGGTEANNLALRASGRVLASAVEHASVLAAVPGAEIIPVGPDGIVDISALERMLRSADRPALVSVMLANNETGVIQPIEQVVAMAHAAGIRVHCDAVEAVGRLPVNVRALGIDYLSLSAHKIGGPTGVGALICRNSAPLDAVALGGGQERRRRAGTENLPGIVGFGAVAREAEADLGDQLRLGRLRDRMEREIGGVAPAAHFHGHNRQRLANTSCIGILGIRAETQVMALDLKGIAVSAGAACSSGKVAASHVLLAMGIDPDAAGCAIRVSLGWRTEDSDVDAFVQAWREVCCSAASAVRTGMVR